MRASVIAVVELELELSSGVGSALADVAASAARLTQIYAAWPRPDLSAGQQFRAVVESRPSARAAAGGARGPRGARRSWRTLSVAEVGDRVDTASFTIAGSASTHPAPAPLPSRPGHWTLGGSFEPAEPVELEWKSLRSGWSARLVQFAPQRVRLRPGWTKDGAAPVAIELRRLARLALSFMRHTFSPPAILPAPERPKPGPVTFSAAVRRVARASAKTKRGSTLLRIEVTANWAP